MATSSSTRMDRDTMLAEKPVRVESFAIGAETGFEDSLSILVKHQASLLSFGDLGKDFDSVTL